jgi:hypothetical protein
MSDPAQSALESALIGCFGGLFATFCVYPLAGKTEKTFAFFPPSPPRPPVLPLAPYLLSLETEKGGDGEGYEVGGGEVEGERSMPPPPPLPPPFPPSEILWGDIQYASSAPGATPVPKSAVRSGLMRRRRSFAFLATLGRGSFQRASLACSSHPVELYIINFPWSHL